VSHRLVLYTQDAVAYVKAIVAVAGYDYAGEHGCAVAAREEKTGPDVLVSNLRGEVGEAITAWIGTHEISDHP
jgi:hypothetical protein